MTGVGGTSLAAIAPGQPTESAWGGHGPSAGGGGGGNSATFAAPTWQQAESAAPGATTTCGGTVPGVLCRMVPDVSASADPAHGDWIYFRGNWYVFGGTSIAAPLWAALVADAVQGCSSAPGLLDPVLYGAGASSAFNDVTTGNNSLFGGVDPAYGAGPGYDLATGWGSPRAVALLALLSGSASGCPTVTGVSPASGPACGGTVVTITGSGFGTGSQRCRSGGSPSPSGPPRRPGSPWSPRTSGRDAPAP